MQVLATPIAGVHVIKRLVNGDERGFLSRLFCVDALRSAGWTSPVAQVNHTFTALAGTVRGLHYQHPPHAELKLISCIRGEVWDVAVDLRAGSSTFLRWHAERLSPGNRRAMLVPEGCAHGFQAMTDDCELIYVHSQAYVPSSEGGVRHDDPLLGIRWPLPVMNLSARDRAHPMLTATFGGIVMDAGLPFPT